MQPQDEHQRPQTQPVDGGRDAERGAAFHALGVAFAKVFNVDDGQVHLGTVNMSASLRGSGGVDA